MFFVPEIFFYESQIDSVFEERLSVGIKNLFLSRCHLFMRKLKAFSSKRYQMTIRKRALMTRGQALNELLRFVIG